MSVLLAVVEMLGQIVHQPSSGSGASISSVTFQQ